MAAQQHAPDDGGTAVRYGLPTDGEPRMDLAATFAPLVPLVRLGRIVRLGRWGRWGRWGRPPAGPRAAAGRPAARPPRPASGQATADDEPALGCGWFDSSWSLRQGLLVTEHEALHLLPDDPR